MTEKDKPEAQVEILEEGPCRKRLKAEISSESVVQGIDASYKQLLDSLQLPGFRKGRVPRSLLERRYAKKIEEDVREELMNTTFLDEVEERELRVLGAPTFDNIEFKVGEPFRYDAVFEVMPTFELGEYIGLEVEEQPVTVSEEDVEAELLSLREQIATLEPVAMGEQQQEDIAGVDVSLFDGDKEVISRPDLLLKIGDDRLDRILVEGLGERLLQAEEGEELRFEVQIPEDFPKKDLRNRGAILKVLVKGMKRRQIPELDNEFAKRFGVESLQEFREELCRNLQTRRQVQEENRKEEQLIEQLAERIDMELPPSLLEKRRESLDLGLKYRLQRQGESEEKIQKQLQESSSQEQARQELKQIFIIERIAEQEKLMVTEQEVMERIRSLAVTYQRDPDEVFEEYNSSGRMAELRDSMLREKSRRFLREKAKILKKPKGSTKKTDAKGEES